MFSYLFIYFSLSKRLLNIKRKVPEDCTTLNAVNGMETTEGLSLPHLRKTGCLERKKGWLVVTLKGLWQGKKGCSGGSLCWWRGVSLQQRKWAERLNILVSIFRKHESQCLCKCWMTNPPNPWGIVRQKDTLVCPETLLSVLLPLLP